MPSKLALCLALLGVSAFAQPKYEDILKNLKFRSIGPATMGGRTDDFAVVESDPRIIYAATAAGGLFKTINGGVTWQAVFENEPNPSIGDVTLAPSNPSIVYVGTGEANNRQSSSWGDGVYKSMDGGATWKHLGLDADAAALLLARVDSPGDAGAAESDAVAAAMTDAGALWVVQSTDDAEAEALFDARRLAYPAFERLGPVLTEDICVPRSAVPAMLAQIEAIGARRGVQIATIAHAGDGNLHPLLVTPPGDEAARTAAQAAFEQLLDAAIAAGGTVTGEHGVGLLKREGMHRELDPGSVALQYAVRHALDPRELFNPGKC